MFSLLPWTTDYTDTMYAILRVIVFVELFQNAWSFTVVSSSGDGDRNKGTLLQQARRGLVSIPWRKTKRENSDDHRLEDVFLDEISESSGSDDDEYHFDEEGKYHLEDILDDGEVIDRGMGGYEEEGLTP